MRLRPRLSFFIIFIALNYGVNELIEFYLPSEKTFFSNNLQEKNSTLFIDKAVINASVIKPNNRNNNTFYLFSHGRSGELLINGKWHNPKEIAVFLNSKFNFKNSSILNLNIYGCEFAKGKKGLEAVSYLENALGLNVAASTNITGKNGDWFLEVGEVKTDIENYQYDLQIPNTDPDEDYDGDNVINSEDLDDDNDGIPDIDEGFCNFAEVNFEYGETTITLSEFDTSSNTDYTQMQTIQGDPSPTAPIAFLNGYDQSAGGSVYNHTFATPQRIWVGENGKISVTIQYYDNISSETGIYRTGALAFNLLTTPVLTGSFTISNADAAILDNGGWVEYTIIFDTNVAPYSVVEINGIKGDIEGNNLGQSDTFDPDNSEVFALSIGTISGCTNDLDTDNDNTPNYFDFDSDNDSCPDAVEAAGNFTQSNLTSSNNLADSDEGSVDSDGIPITDTDDNNISASTPQNTTTAVTTNEVLTIESITPDSTTSYCIGENVTFTATASGESTDFTTNQNTTTALAASAINYQWYESTNGGTTFIAITGETNSTLSLANVQESAPAKQYKVEITSANNGCPEEGTVTLNVNAPPTANAGADKTIECDTTSVTIGTENNSDYEYSWSANPTTSSESLSSTTVSNPTAAPTETTTFTVEITNTITGCKATDDVIVTVNNTPPTADAGQPKTIDCDTTEVTIGPETSTAGYSYSWDNADSLSDSNVWNPTATPSETTTYTLTYTNDETGCSDQETVIVTVSSDSPTANAGDDQTIDCNTTSVTIGTGNTANYEYSWSANPTASITTLSSTTVSNPTATPTVTTTFTVEVTNTTTGCKAYDDVIVTVNNTPPTANAGDDQIIDCNTTSVTIGTTASNGFTYAWSPTNGLSNPNTANPTATPNSTTTYTVTITETETGCTNNDSVTVTVNNTPPTANAGEDKGIDCNTNSVSIGTTPANGFTYSWSPTNGLSNPNAANPTARPNITTTYTVTITETETGCANNDSVTVTVNNSPPAANAGEDKGIDCNTTSASIGTTPANGFTYAWSPTNGLSNPNTANPTATPNSTTTYTVVITDTENGCTDNDSVTVTVNNTPPFANAGEDKLIDCNTTSVTIGTNPVSGFTYTWSPITGLNNPNISNPTASPNSTTTYTLEITKIETGCSDIDDVVVSIDSPHAPSITAPNDINLEGCNVSSTTVNNDNSGFVYSASLITLTPEQETTFLTFINADFAESCDYFITYQDEIIDHSCPKIVLRTYTITNSYGLSDTDTQQIIISDNTPPTFIQTVEPSIYVECNPVPEPQELAAIDNCTVVPDVNFSSQTTTIDEENYSIKRTWIATDDCNNQTTITQYVYVQEASESLETALNLCITDNAVDLNSLFENLFLDITDSPWINTETNTETSNLFSPNESGIGNHTLYSTTNTDSCTLERTVTITVHKDCINIPCISSTDAISISTLVSPNGDTKNETFSIYIPINNDSLNTCDINIQLDIYNRWGALVYKSDNYENDWSGESSSNGKKLPRTTYYYVINVTNSGLAPIQGNFLLGK